MNYERIRDLWYLQKHWIQMDTHFFSVKPIHLGNLINAIFLLLEIPRVCDTIKFMSPKYYRLVYAFI